MHKEEFKKRQGKITNEKMAENIGMSVSTVERYRSGRQEINRQTELILKLRWELDDLRRKIVFWFGEDNALTAFENEQ